MDFYIIGLLSACLIIVPAIISFKKEKKDKYRYWILSITVTGVFLGMYTNYKSNKEASLNKATARTNDSLYKNLLAKNLNSAYKIIDSLDTAVNKTRSLISQNNTILNGQHSSVGLLNKQLRLSSKIQKNVLGSENKLLGSLNDATSIIEKDLTGGDAYPVAEILQKDTGKYMLQFDNHFDNMIPECEITINDYTELVNNCPLTDGVNGKKFVNPSCVLAYYKTLIPQRYEPGMSYQFPTTDVFFEANNTNRKIIIMFRTAKQLIVEQMVYRLNPKIGGNYYYRLSKIKGKDLITIGYSKNVTSNVKIDWDKEFNRDYFFPTSKF